MAQSLELMVSNDKLAEDLDHELTPNEATIRHIGLDALLLMLHQEYGENRGGAEIVPGVE